MRHRVSAWRRPRENFVLRSVERWQPPAFRQPRTRWDRFVAAGRRFLDLQAASGWNDMKAELATARGDLLDVGSGAQPFRPLVPPAVRYRAIDTVAAGEVFGYEVPNTEYYAGDRWPVEDATIDVVLATETLEHIAEPAVFLAEARRVLRSRGRIVITVPFSARWHYIPHDYWRYTPSSLSNLLEAAGFGEVVVHARGNKVTVACYKLMALFLPSLFPARGGLGPRRLVAALMLPLVGVLAMVAHVSLRADGGDDCLGWTATAVAT